MKYAQRSLKRQKQKQIKMTNYEAIIGNLYPYDVDENLILKACIDNDLIETDEYSKDMAESVARVSIDVLSHLISLSSESDSGFSLSYNVDNLKERICAIAKKHGLADVAEQFDSRPTVYIMS